MIRWIDKAFALAIHDGSMAENAFERVASAGAFAEIARSGLGARQGSRIELGTPHLADDLVVALASFERTELLGSALLREVAPPARALLRTATADTPGVFVTRMPCAWAAARSTLSVPVPQIEISRSAAHFSSTSAENLDVDRMLMTMSLSPIRSASSAGPEGRVR